jgi:hypothetical protein
MKYMLLLMGDEDRWQGLSEDELSEAMKAYEDYGRQVIDAGVFVAGEGLQPSSTSTTMRLVDGERVLTDGPFAETKEQLGGFYLLDCKNLDAALEWAEKCPAAAVGGTIEIRPVMDYEESGYDDPRPEKEMRG